jgi:putative hemolysin
VDDSAFTYADPADPLLKRLAISFVEIATGRNRIKRLYFAHQNSGWGGASFFATAVRALSLDLQFDAARLQAIPRDGALVIVANHPFGVLDGIVMCALMQQVRPDFLVLTNSVLLRAPEMRDKMLPVDFAGTPEALATNLATRARAREHLDAGGCVVVFPAGAVSTSPDRFGRERAVDGPWTPFLGRVVRQSRAPVVPIFFPGQNSRLFQMVSHISQTLRLSLFFHEVRRRIGTRFPVAIGELIPFSELANLPERRNIVDELRRRTYALGDEVPAGGTRG